jgi:hypothetical protein
MNDHVSFDGKRSEQASFASNTSRTVGEFLDAWESHKVAELTAFCRVATAAAAAERMCLLPVIATATHLTTRSLRTFALVGRIIGADLPELCAWRDLHGNPLTHSHLTLLATCSRPRRHQLLVQWRSARPPVVKARVSRRSVAAEMGSA